MLALKAAQQAKETEGKDAVWLSIYWSALLGYALMFTAQRMASELGASDATVKTLYFVATTFGAASLIGLSAIILHALLRPWASGFATGITTGLAALIVYLIIAPGVTGPMHGTWSTEFLPNLLTTRILIALAYMGAPLVFAGMVVYAAKDVDAVTRKSMAMFMVSVLLVYESNAIKYVVSLPDLTHLFLAALMAAGTFVGWRSYKPRRFIR